MKADGTGVMEQTIAGRIQSESGLKQVGVLAVPFASKSQHVEWVYARVKHADGTVVETPVSSAIEVTEQVTREAPFYSDLKESQLPLKDLRVGDTLEWQARVVMTTAEAEGNFWGQESFARGAVVLEQTVEVDAPKDIYLNAWGKTVKPAETINGDTQIWRWTNAELKPTVGPEADAAKEAEKKRIRTADEELDERQGKLPDAAWTTFKSWEAVGAWYRGLEGDRMQPDAAVKAKVAQLTAGKTTEEEKVQAVYDYVGLQIHYIGVAFGVGRYQPHSANDVMDNQYGDCKDKHTLLAAMLEAIGLHPDAVLIGAGIRFNQAVPSPGSFNHLITRVEVDGKPVWLDTTAEVAPYRLLNGLIRDHEALVVPESGPARVEKAPATLPFPQTQVMEAVGTLDANGVSTSRITMTFHGDDEVILRSVLRQISPAQYDQMAQGMCSGMGYGGTASHVEVSRADDMSTPVSISFDYKREKAGDWANYRTIPQLAPVQLPRPDEKDPPVESLQLGTPRVESSKSAMKLPAGWGVEFPEAVHVKSKWATIDETYHFDKGTMYAERRVEVLVAKVPQAEWKDYSKFAEKADLGNEQYIQLTRPLPANKGTDKAVTKDVPLSMTSSAEAAKLVVDAYNSIEGRDLAAAEGLLDQAKAINPKQARLWSMYGYLSYQRGAMNAAVEDYRKELELHPDATGVYESLGDAQIYLGRKDDARKSFETWASLDPGNSRAALRLASFLFAEGHPAEAAAAAEAGLAATPEGEKKNEQLELLLGQAQLRAGMKDKGHATLLALVNATENPEMMNNAGYELANAGLELPLVEKVTRTALDQMEAESQTWTLDENPTTLRQKTRFLQATWDSMGWVYFREGRVKDARDYVEASWTGRQSQEVGKHMGEIAEASGEKDAALLDYILADQAHGPDSKVLNEKEDVLRKDGAKAKAPENAMQKMRTISIGPANGLNGVAEYKFLVSSDAVVKAKPTGDKVLAGGEERMLKAKLKGFTPAGSKGVLMFEGMLNCHSGVCEIVIEP
jgi:tetratricopeptide (TPR) repeat protein